MLTSKNAESNPVKASQINADPRLDAANAVSALTPQPFAHSATSAGRVSAHTGRFYGADPGLAGCDGAVEVDHQGVEFHSALLSNWKLEIVD